jgi:hypothetical protein
VCACVSLACALLTQRAKRPETRQPVARIDICTAQEKGVVLSGLLVDERKHGLGGHTLLTLVRSKALSSEASQKHGEPLLPQVCRFTITFIVSARTLCEKVCGCQARLLLRRCRSAWLLPLSEDCVSAAWLPQRGHCSVARVGRLRKGAENRRRQRAARPGVSRAGDQDYCRR